MKALRAARRLAGLLIGLPKGRDAMPEPVATWNIDTLRVFLEERLEENQLRSDERFKLLLAELERDREHFETRFEQGNKFKETFSDSLNRLSTESIKRAEIDAKFAGVQDKVEALSKTKWQVYLPIGALIISMVGGLWTVLGLQVQATVQPMNVAIDVLKVSNANNERTLGSMKDDFNREFANLNEGISARSKDISALFQVTEASKVDRVGLNERTRMIEGKVAGSAQADVASLTDRAQLNERMRKQEQEQAISERDRKGYEASMRAALVEIETQFCANDIVRNLMHANDLRNFSMLYQRMNLGTYPTDNSYYPKTCNRETSSNPK